MNFSKNHLGTSHKLDRSSKNHHKLSHVPKNGSQFQLVGAAFFASSPRPENNSALALCESDLWMGVWSSWCDRDHGGLGGGRGGGAQLSPYAATNIALLWAYLGSLPLPPSAPMQGNVVESTGRGFPKKENQKPIGGVRLIPFLIPY